MQLAASVTKDNPQTQYAMMAVSTNATGIATCAGNRNPTSIMPCNQDWKKGKKGEGG